MKEIELTEAEIQDIKDKAASKIGICKKQNDIIGRQIFSILSLYARVIYYPLGENSVWGFTRIKGNNDDSIDARPFVAINSSIPHDCQVFAAAHELYHIWFETKVDVIPSNIIEDDLIDRNELKANRFAAEFLVEEELLLKEIKLRNIDIHNMNIKDILILSDLFTVPYRTMVKRLLEVNILNKKELSSYFKVSDTELNIYRRRYSIIEPSSNNVISIDNLNELSIDAYEKHLITYEKLEYLLSLSNLTPSELGINEPIQNSYPTDEELAEILGEE